MKGSKADIIAQLRKEIMPLQGLKGAVHSSPVDMELGSIRKAFPNQVFPLGAIHEFCCDNVEGRAATNGFVSALLSSILCNGVAIWVGQDQMPFPPALYQFGLNPDHFIFIRARRNHEILAVMEEALRCRSITAVIAHAPEQGFKESRRFQLAVEETGVTGFFIRHQPKNMSTACTTRWQVKPAKTQAEDGMPGIGSARWKIELIKVRNGKPGAWEVEWKQRKICVLDAAPAFSIVHQQRKTG